MTQKNAEEMWKQISTNLRMTELENYQKLHKESDTREGERKNQKIAKGWNKKAMVVEHIRVVKDEEDMEGIITKCL